MFDIVRARIVHEYPKTKQLSPLELVLQEPIDNHPFVPAIVLTSPSSQRRVLEELREERRVLRQEVLELKVLPVNQNSAWELHGYCKSHDELIADTMGRWTYLRVHITRILIQLFTSSRNIYLDIWMRFGQTRSYDVNKIRFLIQETWMFGNKNYNIIEEAIWDAANDNFLRRFLTK